MFDFGGPPVKVKLVMIIFEAEKKRECKKIELYRPNKYHVKGTFYQVVSIKGKWLYHCIQNDVQTNVYHHYYLSAMSTVQLERGK